jgi:hypothetical protein
MLDLGKGDFGSVNGGSNPPGPIEVRNLLQFVREYVPADGLLLRDYPLRNSAGPALSRDTQRKGVYLIFLTSATKMSLSRSSMLKYKRAPSVW